MNYNPRTTVILITLSLLFFLYFIIPTHTLYAKENRIIKVGYPIVRNFTDKKDGLYTGYVYDYLREIAIYTGWEYVFIEMDLAASMEALKKGEIDLVAGMLKNEQTTQLFDFPNFDIGSTYTTLSTLEDSPYWTQPGYVVLDAIRVGYYETSRSRLTNFMNFCKNNGIQNVMLVPYPYTQDREALVKKLRSKEVDALIGNDLSISDEERVIARFGATQHFLATTKGNTDLINELNKALALIKKRNPDFEEALYTKYFEQHQNTTLILSKAQSDYLKSLPPIKAIYISNYIPAQYYDELTDEAKGDLIDAARLLAKRLGITFEFIPVETYEEAYEMISHQKADVIVGVADDYLIADKHDFILTPHYSELELTKVVNVNKTPQGEPKTIAMPTGHGYIKNADDYEFCYYDTIEECLQAVNEGIVSATYINVNSLSHYLTDDTYNNVAVLPDTQELGIAFGLSKTLDPDLIEILHKTVYYLPEDNPLEEEELNTFQIKHHFNLKTLFYKHIKLFIWMISVLLIIMIIHTKKLAHKAKIDALTGLYNREACMRFVTKYLHNKKPTNYVAFIIIDIDHFKQINDLFGHQKGDALLIEFSKVLKKTFIRQAVSFRLGGDEFIIFIKNINRQSTYKVNEKLEELRSTMHQEIQHNGQSQEISLSIGAILTSQSLSFTQLYTAADEVLYEVKRNGRNGFKVKLY